MKLNLTFSQPSINIKITMFWNMTMCSVIGGYQCTCLLFTCLFEKRWVFNEHLQAQESYRNIVCIKWLLLASSETVSEFSLSECGWLALMCLGSRR
jgi:hypothetical protein